MFRCFNFVMFVYFECVEICGIVYLYYWGVCFDGLCADFYVCVVLCVQMLIYLSFRMVVCLYELLF